MNANVTVGSETVKVIERATVEAATGSKAASTWH
jgi:hypothetical protein